MKALVLTYDKYRPLTEHMMFQYRKLWPNNPFIFRIPYQRLNGDNDACHEYVRSPADIKGTALTLLADLADDEWVYWCIDDKYPVYLDIAGIQSIMQWISTVDDIAVSGVLCSRPRKLTKQKRLTGEILRMQDGTRLLGRKSYKSIWIHQFLRAKVLRHLFRSFPDNLQSAKTMDHLKDRIEKPSEHGLFVTDHSMANFGESTSRGVLTENCYRSLIDNGMPVPEWHTGRTEKANILGEPPTGEATGWRRLFSWWS